MKKTVSLIDAWFNQKFAEVIDKLTSQPRLQLEFLLIVLKEKENIIESIYREDSVAGVESEEWQRYKELLLLNIRLLCEYKKEEVITYAKKKYYPTQACLEICKNYNVYPAIAYLLKQTGAYVASVEMYIKILWEICEKLLDYTKREYVSLNLEDYNKYFNSVIKVCIKHSTITGGVETEQDQWFLVLQHLYEFYIKLTQGKDMLMANKSTPKNSAYELVVTTVNNCIKRLVTVMMEHISFQKILLAITEKHGELEVENFKGIFSSMILSYINQEKILDSAKQIQQRQISLQFDELVKSSCKGRSVENNVCVRCKKYLPVQSGKEYLTFSCGHIYHTSCTKILSHCEVCSKQSMSIK